MDIVVWLLMVFIGYVLGRRAGRQTTEVDHLLPPSTTREIMLREIDSDAVARIVGQDLQQQLRAHYQHQALPARGDARPVMPSLVAKPAAVTQATRPAPVGPPIPRPIAPLATPRVPERQLPQIDVPRPHLRRESLRLDPALVLLYLGAFLVVAAGLIYASFNWQELQGGQKLALLAAATVGFIVTGLALLRNARLRPAAETFVGVGALLIPSNVIAAVTILSDTPIQATLALQIGAVFATLLYTIFSYRPGATVYCYAAVISASVAIGVLPSSLGAHQGWALPLLAVAPTLVIAAVDRLGNRAERFWPPALAVAPAIPAATFVLIPIIGLPHTQEAILIASILAGSAVTLGVVATIRAQTALGMAALVVFLGAVVVANTWLDPAATRMALTMATGAVLLWFSLKGPRLYRTELSEVVALAAVIAFGLTALTTGPIGEMDDLVPWSMMAAPGLIAAGWALVAVARRWSLLMTPVVVLAYLCHVLALGRTGVLDDTSPTGFLLWVLPGTVAAAALATWIHLWPRLPRHRQHAVFLWLGFGALTVPLGAFAFFDASVEGITARLVALAYFAFFTATAIVASQQQHRVHTMVIAGVWLVTGVATVLEPARTAISEEMWFPLYAVTCAILVLLMPLAEGRVWWRRRRILLWPTIVFATSAAVATVPMLPLTVQLIAGTTAPSEAAWWPMYVAVFAGTAVVFGFYARYRYLLVMTSVAAAGAVLASGLLLRVGMVRFDPDTLLWTAIGIVFALLLVLAADTLDRMQNLLAMQWARWIAGYASLILLIAAGRGLAETGRYIASAWNDVTAPHMEEPVWWLPLLCAWAAATLTGHWVGRRRDHSLLSVAAAVTGLSVLALATRMVTTDVFTWTLIGMLLGTMALVSWAVLRQHDAAGGYVRGWLRVTETLQVIGAIALGANVAAGITGAIDPWHNVALYAALTVVAAIVSVRLRLTVGLYASTSALGLTVLFFLLTPQVDPMDGLLIPAAIAWVLLVASLTPRLRRRWAAPLENSGYVFGAAPILYPMVQTALAWNIDSMVYQRVTLAVASLGFAIGLAALARRSPVRASVAIPLVTVAILRQVATVEPESWQPYAAVLAVALVVAGLAWHRTHRISDALYAVAGAVLIGTPFIESFTIGDTTDAFIAGGYAILVVAIGLLLRRQEPVAVGVLGVTLVVMRQLVDTAMAFESWQVLGTTGATLLIGGTIILMIRDTLRHWFDSARHYWHSLG